MLTPRLGTPLLRVSLEPIVSALLQDLAQKYELGD